MDKQELERIKLMEKKGNVVGDYLGMRLHSFCPNYGFGHSNGIIADVTVPACAVDLIYDLHLKNKHLQKDD